MRVNTIHAITPITMALPTSSSISDRVKVLARVADTVIVSTTHLPTTRGLHDRPNFSPRCQGLKSGVADLRRGSRGPGVMSSAAGRARSGAGLEDRVDLGAVLQHFPGADEAGGDHEGIARTEGCALPVCALDDDTSLRHDAQLVLRIAHAPLAAARRPAPGEELLRGIAEEVAHLELRLTGAPPP